MKQTTVFRQTTHLAPQQIMVAKMVEATDEELDKLIVAETEKNVALELTEGDASSDADYETSSDDYSADEEGSGDDVEQVDPLTDSPFCVYDDDEPTQSSSSANNPYFGYENSRNDQSFRDELLSQIDELELPEEDDYLARYIVESLDDNGYLSRQIPELVEDLAFTQMYDTTEEKMERVLVDVVQSLEPAGIGARNLRECLLLQLQEKKATSASELAYDILDQAFEDFSYHRIEHLCKRFSISSQQLAEATRVITHLSPFPGGNSVTSDQADVRASHIKPAFSIHNVEGELEVRLYNSLTHGVRISPDYQEMLERIQQSGNKSEDSMKGLTMIRESIAQGNQFIDAIEQRRQTLSTVIHVLAQMQHDYFMGGGNSSDLRPMVLKDVAERAGYDISTISRVSNSKYIETDFGIIAVKDLFTSAIQTGDGETISQTAVQDALRELIDAEDKRNPLSDDALSELLKSKGFPVARRTVAKYRELLKYPTARLRREV